MVPLSTAKKTLRGKWARFRGSDGGPQGPRWLIHGPLPRVRWVERRKGAFGSLERVLMVLTLLESS